MGSNYNDVCMALAVLSENNFDAPVFFWDPNDSQTQEGYLYKLGNANSIKGFVYFDKNNNGVKDIGETGFSNVNINTQKTGYLRTAIPYNGDFKIDVDTGTFTTTVLLNNLYYNSSPATHISSFSNYFNVDTISFGIAPIPGKRDVNIHLIPLTNLRPGFTAKYKMMYSNVGTDTVANGLVRFVKNNRLSLDSSYPVYSTMIADTATWNITNLKPGDTASIYLYLKVAPPPQANIGDTSKSVASIETPVNDETVNDNTSTLSQIVVNSFDPNDKLENHGGSLKTKQIADGDFLLYTIRFQNTGNDTAFNVIVRDTLSEKLDWNSLQMIASSHNYQMNIKDGNKIAWLFSNIKLVDSFKNEPASHGYIVFRVKPIATVALGDTIKNTAAIYFDFNLPVITNTQTTIVENDILPIQLLAFTAKKIDSKNKLEWQITHSNDIQNFVVERATETQSFSQMENIKAGNKKSYTIYDNLPVGGKNYYRLQIISKDGKKVYSPVRMIDNSLPFYATLYPNPVKNNLWLKIQTEKNKNIQINITSSDGKNISFYTHSVLKGTSNIKLPISGFTKGVYFVFIQSENEQIIKKIVKL